MEEEKQGRLEKLLDEWDEDSKIDPTELGDASLHGSRLHAKWLRYRAIEKLRLYKLQVERDRLKKEKHEFYLQGPTKESRELGWVFPPAGMVLKGDLPVYMDADEQMVQLNLRIAYQREIVDAIDLVFVALKGRGFDIGRKIEDVKIKMGNG